MGEESKVTGAGETLYHKLKSCAASGVLPMHMPGHKRNTARFPWLRDLSAAMDITEIEGFDNLNDPEGLFCETNELLRGLWGAKHSFALVNGSTAGLLAAVKLALPEGGGLLMSRGSHKALYNAAELVRADVTYILPPTVNGFGFFASVTPESVEKALSKNGTIRLVAITSPTYEGVISDIAAIAEVCCRHGARLLVDEAHGAHLGFGGFPDSAVTLGADLVVQSLHKTLPCLTQTAVLHICTDGFSAEAAQNAVSVFQSSSPSYLLSSAIDGCARFMRAEGESAAQAWLNALNGARELLRGLKALRLFDGADEGIFACDPSKLVLSTRNAGLSGAELMARLREDYHIELEMAAGDYAVAMTGMGDTAESIAAFCRAVTDLDSRLRYQPSRPESGEPTLPPRKMPAFEASARRAEAKSLRDAVGRVSAEYVWLYPPGVPMIVPGELVTDELTAEIRAAAESGLAVRSSRKGLPERLFCLCGEG